jgi:DNA-binding transcriptional ArsR family regulator
MPTASLDATFAALADPTRRAILNRLAHGEATVNELARPFAISGPAITKHLKVLERAGLISRRRVGQSRPCKLEPQVLEAAADYVEQYRQLWEQRFDRLDDYLHTLQAAPENDPSQP